MINDRETGKTLYSIDGKEKYNSQNKTLSYQNYAPQYITAKYVIIVGFYEKKGVKDYTSMFLNKLTLLTITSIFFVSICAITGTFTITVMMIFYLCFKMQTPFL